MLIRPLLVLAACLSLASAVRVDRSVRGKSGGGKGRKTIPGAGPVVPAKWRSVLAHRRGHKAHTGNRKDDGDASADHHGGPDSLPGGCR